jgi:hypothetical protein
MDKEDRESKWRCIAAQQISKVLKDYGTPLSKTEVRGVLAERATDNGRKGLRGATIVQGFELLIDNGWVTVSKEGREQKLTLVKEYVETYAEQHADETQQDPF